MLTARGKCAVTVFVSVVVAEQRRSTPSRRAARATTTAITRPDVADPARWPSLVLHGSRAGTHRSGSRARLDGVGVEPRAGADDVAEDGDVGAERGERRLQLLLLAVEQREQLVDLLASAGADLRLVVLRRRRAARRPGSRALTSSRWIASLRRLRPPGRPGRCSSSGRRGRRCASASTLLTLCELFSSAWICSSREATDSREPGDAAEALLDLGRGLVRGVGDDVERLLELVGVDPLGGRGQVAEDADDVVRRLGAVDAGSRRPRRAGRSRPARARGTSRRAG